MGKHIILFLLLLLLSSEKSVILYLFEYRKEKMRLTPQLRQSSPKHSQRNKNLKNKKTFFFLGKCFFMSFSLDSYLILRIFRVSIIFINIFPMTRLRNRSNSSPIGGSSFSFIVPFTIALIILIVIIRYVFSSTPTENHTGSFITITPKQEQSEIYIYMSGDSKKRIDGVTKMYATDSKLSVSLGEAEVSFENSPSKLFIDK